MAITAPTDQASWTGWSAEAVVTPVGYGRAVAAAGGLPVVVSATGADPAEIADRVDGLILSGGADIEPARYGAARNPRTGPPQPERDEFELALLAAALERRLPVLAICRGLQVLNVGRGGTLHQHLPDAVGHDGHRPTPGSYAEHRVRVAPGSRLADILGWPDGSVPTHHHQAPDRLGRGLVAVAWTDDGVIEAAEDPAFPFVVGVQWHPEAGSDHSVFGALVAAAAEPAGAGVGAGR